ncbi:MAG: M13 family metallopeptidase [Pseudomonadota bacterium]|nr:M13 family metallopeptidase [Pseudomonadota bacterium]
MIAMIAVPAPAQQVSTTAPAPQALSRYGLWGVDTSAMDRTVRPGDDFALHAFGNWYRNTPIPAGERGVWNRFEMERLNDERIRSVVEGSARTPTTANQRLIGDLYNSFMDEARLEQLNAAPLTEDLAAIRSVSSRAELAHMMGRTHGAFGLAFFEPVMMPDVRNPTRYILRLHQGGLGARSREPYLDQRMSGARAAYEAHAARMLQLAGWRDPSTYARQIVEIETRIAAASWSQTESEDLARITNYMTLAELERFAPGFPWRSYLAGAGLGRPRNLVVAQKSAFPQIAEIFANAPLETLKAWLAFHVVDQAAPYLSSRFQQAHFDFWGRMEGLESPLPRSQRAVMLVNSTLSHPVAREYMARFFPAATKAKLEEMVGHITTAMAARIRGLDWLSPQTKAEALTKLSSLRVGIGYPDGWRDYSGLELTPGDLYGNVQATRAYNWQWQVEKLRRPVDREEWTDAAAGSRRAGQLFPQLHDVQRRAPPTSLL